MMITRYVVPQGEQLHLLDTANRAEINGWVRELFHGKVEGVKVYWTDGRIKEARRLAVTTCGHDAHEEFVDESDVDERIVAVLDIAPQP